MSRRDGELEKRPERVIILDADDPMTEVHGRFVWQDEHDRVVDEVRTQAFMDGYAAGQRDVAQKPAAPVQIAQKPAAPVQIEFHRRRTFAANIKLGLLIVAAVCILLMLPVLLGS